MKLKKGEITTEQIVGLVIVLIGFIVILIWLFFFNPKQTSDYEICHNSVVMRSAGFLSQQLIPLNCKTNYICISKDGTCEEMTNPQVVKVNTADDVYSVLANQMYDCWSTYGEGKLDYIGNDFTSDSYCSICSQVAFDNSLEKIFPPATIRSEEIAGQSANNTEIYWRIDKIDFYNYLANTNVSGKDVTYLNYFLGIDNTKNISDVLKANNAEFGTINLEDRYIVVMSEFSKVGPLQDVIIGIGKGLKLFVVLPIPVIGGPLAMSIIASTLTTPGKTSLLGTVIEGESGHYYLTPTLLEANSEDYNQLKCADVNTLA